MLVTYISVETAIEQIINRLIVSADFDGVTPLQRLQIEQFVYDIVDYCHRDDFPTTLVLTVANLIAMHFITEPEHMGTGPLKALEENDTRFEFAVADADTTDLLSNQLFGKIRPKLNLYRKLVCNG
ncbi:hypothetical protein [Veillonella seminalis]|uniref:Uncharacterized protein n=1 Tax=Veillonella seminalis ACS-216-V-Col6b TaxID=883156 RepID=K9D7F1_9FIRM|nr:hypothetical protein [Veillonella seminalis]EKU79156.1 hypothetical protein HMPREF9282_00953 [Veillonella seminalis ACS-216-V-Col6b]